MKLSDNTILITGGTSGIGRGLAERLARLGNTVIICGRRQERLDEINRQQPEIVTRQCDLNDAAQREALIAWAIDKYPATNVLINNAGVQFATDLTRPIDVDELRGQLETNVVAPVHLTSLIAGHLQAQPRAAIINISSGLGFVPIASMPVYCATKAALHSLTLSLRKQLEGSSVQVFEIAPPAVDTELGSQRRVDTSQSHGGMPVREFVDQALQALEHNALETGIGGAANLMQFCEQLFDRLNAAA